MTPPEHLFIGWSCANIFYCVQSFFEKKFFSYIKIVLAVCLVAMLPDIDSFFGNYTSTDPYIGHRGMTHSFLGVFVIALIITIFFIIGSIIIRLIIGYWKFLTAYFKKKELGQSADFSFWHYAIFPVFPIPLLIFILYTFLGGVSHLIADLPQPPSVWKGLPLFFPSKTNGEYIRYGGWAYMGWYDLKVLWVFIGASISSIPVIIIGKFFKLVKLKIIAFILFGIVVLFNIGVMVWAEKHIKSNRYQGESAWTKQQLKMVKTLPKPIKKITEDGIRIFYSIFNQAMRY